MRTAMLSVAMLALPACASAPRVPTSAETLASLTHERQIVAVHYHALGTPGPLHNGARLAHGSVTMAAPTGWIKDRFVQSLVCGGPVVGVQPTDARAARVDGHR